MSNREIIKAEHVSVRVMELKQEGVIMLSRKRLHHGLIALLVLQLLSVPAMAAEYNSGVTARVVKKTTVTGNGEKIAYPRTDRAEVTAMTVDIAPGAATGWHKHPVPVYAYVVSGNLSVELEGGKELTFAQGDAIIEVVDSLHNGINRGTEPVKLAVFYLGIQGEPTVIKPKAAPSPVNK